MRAIIFLMYVDLLRMYISLFQLSRILIVADDKFNLTFNMVVVLAILVFHIVFIVRVLFRGISKKKKMLFYVINMALVFFGMIHKLIGFEKALEMRKAIIVNFILATIAFGFIAGVLNTIEKCED